MAPFKKRLREPDCDYLCVDDFLTTLVEARALKTALDLHLIDFLCEKPACSLDQLAQKWGGDGPGLGLLLELLKANRVVEQDGQLYRLSAAFIQALVYRDLLEAKLDFADLAARDCLDGFTALVHDPRRFMAQARIFQHFDYSRCLDPSADNLERTRRWLRWTTCLTRYESGPCLRRHDFGRYEHMLDIGGNSGEFALQATRAHPRLRATVFDLPVVCQLGRQHVAAHPETGRITFVPGNALTDSLPGGFDLVSFKSMLHDWPDLEAKRLMTRASQCLNPGGTLLIFERAPLDVAAQSPLPYALLPMLLFFRSFRSPAFYTEHLQSLGFGNIATQIIHLEMPFFLITANLSRECSN